MHVRTKKYGQGGKYDLDNRWKQGVYVGPSSDVQHGQVVRFKEGGHVTSVHMSLG